MNGTDKVTDECNQTTLFPINKHSVSYTLPDVLDYLQAEWARMEMERSEWGVERAELQTKIAFLQSECKGQENLKTDLVRRIKMLEYALIQERNKNYKLKYPSNQEPTQPSVSPTPQVAGLLSSEHTELNSSLAATRWLEERMRLKAYLINAGLGDAMSQLRQARVRELLELTGSDGQHTAGAQSFDSLSVDRGLTAHSQLPTDCRVNENVMPSTSAIDARDSVSKLNDADAACLSVLPNHHSLLDATDPETAEALAEFELLVVQQDRNDRVFSGDAGLHGDTSKSHLSAVTKDWDQVDETELLKHLKEQYRADRIKAQSPHLVEASANSAAVLSAVEACGDTRVDEVDEGPVGLSFMDYDAKRPFPGFASDVRRQQQQKAADPSREDDDDELGTNTTTAADAVWFDFKVNLPGDKGRRQQPASRVPSKSSHTPSSDAPGGQTLATASVRSPSPTQTLGLGDLGNLTVANEAPADSLSLVPQRGREAYDGDNTNGSTESREDGASDTSLLWTPKYTLRSHFDAVRAIGFHPIEPILVTASEDHTLKLWNLNKTVQTKKSSSFDVEPVYTFRGHDSPILSLATWATDSDTISQPSDGTPVDPPTATSLSQSSCGFTVFSGDLTGHLRVWHLPNVLQIDPYDTYDAGVMGPTFMGHTNAIWALDIQVNGLLLSASADGTACLWSPWLPSNRQRQTQAPLSVYHLSSSLMAASRSIADFASTVPMPTRAVFLQQSCGGKRFAAGFTMGHIGLFDIETSQLVTTFKTPSANSSSGDSSRSSGQTIGTVTCLVSHPVHPWVISGHEDCSIRIYDVNTGLCVHSMVAHLDTVTTISLSSPQGSHLLSASHDCSIRLWDLQKKTCTQEITSHRRKCAESVNAVAFHPLRHYMASGGADALVKVFV